MFLSRLRISENVNLNRSMFGRLLLLCILLRIPCAVFLFILGMLTVMEGLTRRKDQIGGVSSKPWFI